MSTALLLEVAPEIDSNPTSFYRGESFRFQTRYRPALRARHVCPLTYFDLATPLGIPVYMHYAPALEPTRIAVRTRGFILKWQ